MASIDDRIQSRLDELLSRGQQVLDTARDGAAGTRLVNKSLAQQWYTSCSNLLIRTVGESSPYFKDFKESKNSIQAGHFNAALAVLKAFKEDFEAGMLFERDELLKAEIFEDLLDQAQHLLDHGYAQPAASLAGAVLESDLRNLCRINSIPLTGSETLEPLRVKLKDADIINAYEAKDIVSWGEIRNAADHGNWAEKGYGPNEARELVENVRKFAEKHLP